MKKPDSLDPLETLLNMMPDRTSKSNILTPVKIAKEMVNSLPDDVWNSQSKFLDIACKSGIFLYEIQKKLMETPSLITDFPDTKARRQHILQNQLYGIAMDNFSQLISIRTVYGRLTPENNIATIERYTDKVKGFTLDQFKKTLEKEFKQKDMKFDVVVGNPPYNKGMDLDFVDLGYKLSQKYTCMITPAKWQTAEANQRVSSNISYGEFRQKIVPHMSYVCFYPDCLDVFCIQETSGISYFFIDKDKEYEGCCTVKNSCVLQSKINGEVVRDITHRQSLWNIGEEIVNHLQSNFQGYHKLKIEKQPVCKEYCVLMNTQGQKQLGQSGAYDWARGEINKDYLGKGGVAFNKEGKASVIGAVQLAILQGKTRPREEATEKIVIFTSDSRAECESYMSYVTSKMVKFLVFITLSSMRTANNNSFRFVPAPPSGKFDHIYTDEELYKAFNLPQKYIDVIESVIKERK